MAVLIEAISVVIRADALGERYSGGRSAFEAAIPNDTYCTDGELIRVGFMTQADVRAYVERLEQRGLRYADASGAAVNVVVVDQHTGLLAACAWAGFGRAQIDADPSHIVSTCYAIPTTVSEVVTPPGWSFDRSLTARSRFVPTERLDEELEFLRSENGVDVYRDRRTGQEYYVGRSK